MRAALALLTMLGLAYPAWAGDGKPLEAPAQPGYHLRGVVGHSISVSLPARAGYTWLWEATGRPLFAPPYKVTYQAMVSPEIWTFPLVRPGTITLSFKLVADGKSETSETRTVELQVLTPYEAQQHPLASLLDTLLLR